MKSVSTLRRIIPLVAVIALALFATSCASNKKYGCPNKLQIEILP